jgi:hypothetical protein
MYLFVKLGLGWSTTTTTTVKTTTTMTTSEGFIAATSEQDVVSLQKLQTLHKKRIGSTTASSRSSFSYPTGAQRNVDAVHFVGLELGAVHLHRMVALADNHLD